MGIVIVLSPGLAGAWRRPWGELSALPAQCAARPQTSTRSVQTLPGRSPHQASGSTVSHPDSIGLGRRDQESAFQHILPQVIPRQAEKQLLSKCLWCPWPGSSVGWPAVLTRQGFEFNLQVEHIQAAASECMEKWNNKLMSLPRPSLFFFLSPRPPPCHLKSIN